MKAFAVAFVIGLLCCTTVNAQPAPPQPWGTILGRIVYDGKPPVLENLLVNKDIVPGRPPKVPDESLVVDKNGGLANVFVFLRSKPSEIHPGYAKSEPQKILFEVKDYRYVPHALIIWTHDIVVFRNREPYGVNPNYTSATQGIGTLLPRGGDHQWRLRVSENLPKPIGCNIHPWMYANILVRDNPYFGVTDERGIFCIPNLPAIDELEFVFWHERFGYLKNLKSNAAAFTTNDKGRLTTKLTQPVTDVGEFRIDPASFQGKQ